MPSEVVIVTGANNGIGLALARALVEAGYRVAAFDLSGENLTGLRFYACDITQPQPLASWNQWGFSLRGCSRWR